MSIVATPDIEKNRNGVVRFLNRLVSKRDYGTLYDPPKGKPHPVHANTKLDVLRWSGGGLRKWDGSKKNFLSSITRQKYADHWDNQATMYFTAGEGDTMLLMVDIDCHDKGGIKEATTCAEFLREKLFPGMYYEPSTNGRGVHGYLLVERDGRSNEEVAQFYKQMQDFIRQWEHLDGVEMIEVKGNPHFFHKAPKVGYYVQGMTMGQLAKVPRQIVDRFREFQNTGVVRINDFDFDVRLDGVEAKVPGKKVGSWDPKLVKPARYFEATARLVMGNVDKVKITDDLNYNVKDFAAGIAIVLACSQGMNEDGTLPTKRVQALWEAAYKSGEIERPWNDRRWSRIRDRMWQYGMCDVVDETYCVGVSAMKWSFTKAVVDELATRLAEGEAAEQPSVQAYPHPSRGERAFIEGNSQTLADRWSDVLDYSPEGTYPVPEEVYRNIRLPSVEVLELEERLEHMLRAA